MWSNSAALQTFWLLHGHKFTDYDSWRAIVVDSRLRLGANVTQITSSHNSPSPLTAKLIRCYCVCRYMLRELKKREGFVMVVDEVVFWCCLRFCDFFSTLDRKSIRHTTAFTKDQSKALTEQDMQYWRRRPHRCCCLPNNFDPGRIFQGDAPPRKTWSLPWEGDPCHNPIHGSLVPPESIPKTAFRSVQPFLLGLTVVTNRHTCSPR